MGLAHKEALYPVSSTFTFTVNPLLFCYLCYVSKLYYSTCGLYLDGVMR